MGPRPRPRRGWLDVELSPGAAQRGAAYGPVLLVNSETFSFFFFFSVYSPLKADGSVSNRRVLFFSHNALDFTTVSFVDAWPGHVAQLSHFRPHSRLPTKTRLASTLDSPLTHSPSPSILTSSHLISLINTTTITSHTHFTPTMAHSHHRRRTLKQRRLAQ